MPPPGDWRSWVILGGRGAGKTRAGAEWVRAQVEGAMPFDKGRAKRVALVGETFDQVRDVMIFGDSGILACSPEDRRPTWEGSKRRLVWPNGAIATVHSASSPGELRGPQFDAAWVDEYGCAAVDKATNQPNKFLDPKSSEGSLPAYSNGARDDLIQMQYIRAMTGYYADAQNNPVSAVYSGPMVDMSRAFVWAWDARPYPYFPNNRDLWSDGENYAKGHWLNGRTSARPLASVVQEICARADVTKIDTSRLFGYVRGYTVGDVGSGRSALQPLMLAYGFDAVERDGVLRFVMREGQQPSLLDPDWLARNDDLDGVSEQERASDVDMAGRVRLQFVQADGNYEAVSEEAVLPDEATHAVSTSEIPFSLTRAEGRQMVERWLAEARVARDSLRFALPPSRLDLGAGDVITLDDGSDGPALRYRIDRVEQGVEQVLNAVRIEPSVYVPAQVQEDPPALSQFSAPTPVMPFHLDLPLMRGDEVPHAPYIAATASFWPGSAAVYTSPTDSNYALNMILPARATAGVTQSALPQATPAIWDNAGDLVVNMIGGTLESASDEAVLAGANLAAIGDGTPGGWELIQFGEAELIAPDTYALRRRLRGQQGTEGAMPAIWPAGSWFVLLNGALQQMDLGANMRQVTQYFRIGPAQLPFEDPSFDAASYAFDGNGLRPFAPVHLQVSDTGSGDQTISWIRRTRIDGDNWEGEVPIGEETESYRLQILKDGTLLREVTATQPNWTYPAALQAQDGATGVVDITVAQVSERYGPGTARSTSIQI